MSQMALKGIEETIYLDSRGFYAALKSSSLTTNGSDFVNKNNDSFHENEDRTKSLSEVPEWFEVPFLVNITRDMPFEYAVVMFGYIMPFLLIITIVANILIVLVLSQRHMRTPTNIVLLSMAIADLLTLLFPAPWYFYMYTLDNHWKVLYPTTACYAYYYMNEVIPAFFHTASIWLTLLLACQRYIYVCHPCAARTWCTTPRVIKAICAIFLMAFMHQFCRFFDRQYIKVRFLWHESEHWGCQFLTSDWVRDIEDIYYTSYYTFRIIFVHIGPCAALVVFNVLLFIALRVAQDNRVKLFNNTLNSENRKIRDSNSTTIMLIVVVSVFLVVEIPLAVTTLLHVMQNALDLHIASYEILNTTIVFSNFFIIVSYPVNFAIYCGMSRLFRETFNDLFIINKSERRNWSSRYTTVVNGDGVTKLVSGSRRYSVANNGINGLNGILINNNGCHKLALETML